MGDLQAMVKAIEMGSGPLPVSWFLVRSAALMAPNEWSWTIQSAEGTRFPVEIAEALSHERRNELPMLPTEPPSHPYFVSPFFDRREAPPAASPVATRQDPEPQPRRERTLRERVDAAKRGAKTRRFNGLQAHAEWEKEHEES